MPRAKITSKGQITIPASVRRRLDLSSGDELVFRFHEDGELTVFPASRSQVRSLAGSLHHFAKHRPVTVEEMKAAVRRRASERGGKQ